MGGALLNTRCEEIAESDNTPLHVGSLGGLHAGMHRDIAERGDRAAPRRRAAAQPPVPRRQPLAGHRRHRARSSTTASSSASRRPPPTTSTSAAPARAARRSTYRHVRRGADLQRDVHRPRGRPRRQHVVPLHRQHARTARGDGGPVLPDRLRPARRAAARGARRKHSWPPCATLEALIDYAERMLRAEIAKIPDGTYPPRAGSTTTASTATCPRARRDRDRRGRGRHRRPHRARRPSAPTR